MASKRLLITTPVFYVNARPHIGHAYTAVLADSLARFERMRGRDVLLMTGTDEHGAKVAKAAARAGQGVEEYCAETSALYRALFARLEVSHDEFVRTTEERHARVVENAWGRLRKFMYESVYAGHYSEREEAFVREHEAGPEDEWVEERTTMFDMQQAKPALMAWLRSKRRVIVPEKRRAEVLDFCRQDMLKDLSVSRPAQRMLFGLSVPGDASSSIYVWLDALMVYLTVGGGANAWPPHLQVIGKDIVRFHALYWPAFLMGMRLEPPKRLLVHGHWTVEGEKMSKSVGNVVDPHHMADKYGVDALRYFLLAEATLEEDANFSEARLVERAERELGDTLGNLVSRCTAASLNKNARWPTLGPADDQHGVVQESRLFPARFTAAMEAYQLRQAVEHAIALCREANRFFEDKKPWHMGEGQEEELQRVLYTALETVRVATTALQVVIPGAATRVLDHLGVGSKERTLAHLEFACESVTRGDLKPGRIHVFEKKKTYD